MEAETCGVCGGQFPVADLRTSSGGRILCKKCGPGLFAYEQCGGCRKVLPVKFLGRGKDGRMLCRECWIRAHDAAPRVRCSRCGRDMGEEPPGAASERWVCLACKAKESAHTPEAAAVVQGGQSSSPHPHTGNYGVACPHCGSRPVATAKRLWFMYGLVLVARYGSQTVVGCGDCARSQALRMILVNAVAGWWCFPWGLGTPIVILQNLLELVRPQNTALIEELLAASGIDPDDVRLDCDGLTGEQRRMVDAAFTVVGGAIFADGHVLLQEMSRAVALLRKLTDGRISESRIRSALQDPEFRSRRLSGLSHEYRVALLRMCLDVLWCDGSFSDAEMGFYYAVAARLGFRADFAKRVLDDAFGAPERDRASESNPEICRACGLLGIKPNATLLEIRKAYRQMILRYHPDRAGGCPDKQAEYTSRAQDINWAYEYLRAANCGDGDNPVRDG